MSELDTKFADMPAGVRARWLTWANSHDWGAGEARFTDNLETGETALHVECLASDNEGGRFVETELCATPRDLRNWAGY